MREPYVSRPNYPLLLAVIALHALMLTYALRPGLFGVVRDRIAPANAHAGMSADAAQAAAKQQRGTAQPAADAPVDDPRREFDVQTWVANDERVNRRQTQAIYGQFDDPLASDPAKALDEIRRRYAAGDEKADRIRYAIAWECSTGERLYEETLATTEMGEHLSTASPADAALARRVHEAGRERWNRIKPRCAQWNAQPAEWKAATLKYRQADAPAARFERLDQEFNREAARDPQLLRRLLEAIEALWGRKPDGELARRLGLYLVDLDDTAVRERGLAMLATLADGDVRYAQDMAFAYTRLGEAPPYDRDKAVQWAERAAQAGAATWIADRAEKAAQAGDAAGAWAWHAWALWLNAQGCHVARGSYGEVELAAALGRIGKIDATLDADTHREAGRRYRALVAAHGAQALAANDCAP